MYHRNLSNTDKYRITIDYFGSTLENLDSLYITHTQVLIIGMNYQ